MTDHPVNGLDDIVHQRVRPGILAISREARKVEFGFLRSTLDLTAGNLSQHLTVLEKAGLITVEKGYEGRRGRTWVQLTTTWTCSRPTVVISSSSPGTGLWGRTGQLEASPLRSGDVAGRERGKPCGRRRRGSTFRSAASRLPMQGMA